MAMLLFLAVFLYRPCDGPEQKRTWEAQQFFLINCRCQIFVKLGQNTDPAPTNLEPKSCQSFPCCRSNYSSDNQLLIEVDRFNLTAFLMYL